MKKYCGGTIKEIYMPRKPKYTKEQLIDAALAITREEGFSEVCARTLGERLGTAPATVFTHYDSVEEIREATRKAAHKIYCDYIDKGLSDPLPFKGCGMQFVRFAVNEPNLFKIIFMKEFTGGVYDDYLVSEGNQEKFIGAIIKTFNLPHDKAEFMYRNMLMYAHGMASMIATGGITFTEEQISTMLSDMCRSILLGLVIPTEDFPKYIPKPEA